MSERRCGRLAQLVRAPALQAGGRQFEPVIAHQIINLRNCGVVGLTHRPVKPEIAGSSPVSSAKDGSVAQLVEQRTENPRVGGSIPP